MTVTPDEQSDAPLFYASIFGEEALREAMAVAFDQDIGALRQLMHEALDGKPPEQFTALLRGFDALTRAMSQARRRRGDDSGERVMRQLEQFARDLFDDLEKEPHDV